MDLYFNSAAPFTRWVVASGHLRESFVVVDVGVQGGENPRWHLLGEHLVVHGIDAIKEVIEELDRENTSKNRHYHWLGVGSVDEEREFYFNALDPCSSSFYAQSATRFDSERQDLRRLVQVRRLDTLLKDGFIAAPDFLKIDVEGFEKEVLLGAPELLRSVLGVESETNFGVSPVYPSSHLGTLQELLLKRHLLVFDLSFNRIPRASFQAALAARGIPPVLDQQTIGKPATLNVLFCRDPIDELDHSNNYVAPALPFRLDQLIKAMIIYELHGLSDIALDTAVRFRDTLGDRLDVDKAISLLADPNCRTSPAKAETDCSVLEDQVTALGVQLDEILNSRSWKVTAPLRALNSALHRKGT